MEVDLNTILTLIGIGVPIVGLMIEHFHFNANTQERMARLETKIDLFWGALEHQLPSLLLKGNPISTESKLYQLLTLYDRQTIGRYQLPELVCLLEDESKNPEHTPGEILAMLLLTATIKAKTGEEMICLK